ncbi:hypothetical protein [Streptomyces sp. NPDC007088]|uniref:hypothetical protein n=1 Tax=Streptomyces sp. NPDC007088 TaxID=3364773 RepID=UPI0036BC6894
MSAGDSTTHRAPLALRLLAHEWGIWVSLGRWVSGRRHGLGAGRTGFGYARAQASTMWALVFVAVVETVMLALLLRPWPVAHLVVLVADVWTLALLLGVQAAAVTRPHVVDEETVRIRRGLGTDVLIPRTAVLAVRRQLRLAGARAADPEALELDVASQTTVTLELAAPVRVQPVFGPPRYVRRLHVHADEPDALVAALAPAPRP